MQKNEMPSQIDSSRHDWLEGRGSYLTPVGAIDDAAGKVSYALFREQEDAQRYFLLLCQIVISYSICLAPAVRVRNTARVVPTCSF